MFSYINHGLEFTHMANVLKFECLFLFLFSNKIFLIRAGIQKMLVRIAKREDPDKTASKQSDLVPFLARLVLQAASV